MSLLDDSADKPLTVLAAPAGAGKSAALSAWIRTRHASVAWLSLDEPDSDRRRFWTLLLEALHRSPGGDALDGLSVRPGESLDVLLPELVNELESLDDPVTVVLDDLQRAGSAEIYADLESLLRHPAANLRLIVSTRVDPPIGVERLRLAGHVAELRAGDLAFTLEEAHGLFELLQIDLASEEVEVLWRRAEGWAAGLRLAARTIAGQPHTERIAAELAGDESSIAEYLMAEVLELEPPDVREFLLRASVVEELPVELAIELTGRLDSGPLLDELMHRHAFVSAVGDRRGTYRLHTLFAELLRAQLRYERPDGVSRLHDLAARWYARHDAPVAALRHAVESGEEAFAVELARACWIEAIATGEFSVLRSLVAQIPRERGETDPEVALAFAASLLGPEQDDEVDRYLRLAVRQAAGLTGDRRRRFAVARAAVLLYRARARGDLRLAQRAAELLLSGTEASDGLATQMTVRALALSTVGIVELWHNQPDAGMRHLERALAIAGDAELDWIRLLCNAYLALGSVVAGHLAACEQRVQATLDLAVRRGWSRTEPAGIALTVLAVVQCHWSLLAEADATLDRAAMALRHSRERPVLALHGLCRGRVRAAQGRFGEALEAFDTAAERIAGWAAPNLQSMLLTEAALVRSRMGQREAAERELKLVVPAWSGATVGLASLALAAGDAESAGEYVVDALNCLEQLIPADRVEAWALDALVGDVLADHERASRSIERALDLAEPGGYRQALVAQGAVLQPILVRQLRLGTAHRAFVEDLLLALDDGAERGSGKPQLAEPLTGREAAILRFLPTTMSNHQIASELFVSVNTIKTHLRSIYRKLDAGDRREAVVKAREMQLLAPGIARRAWLQSLPRR